MKVRLSHLIIGIVGVSTIVALLLISGSQSTATSPNTKTNEGTNGKIKDKQPNGPPVLIPALHEESATNVAAMEPLMRSVKDEIKRMQLFVSALNANINTLLSRVERIEDQEGDIDLADVSRTISGLEHLNQQQLAEIKNFFAPVVIQRDETLIDIRRRNRETYLNAIAIEDENLVKIKTNPQARDHYKQHTFLHYLFEPVWSCPNKEKVPFVADDGAKYVCDTSRFAQLGDDCIIYSIGVNNKAESMFDFDLATRFPNCRFFLFDPSLDHARHNELVSSLLPNMEFHDWGIAPTISSFNNGKPLLPLDEIKRRLGHTGKRITSLKIDTEGAEWLTLPAFMETEEATLVDEMQIEVHFYSTNFEVIIPFFESIRNKGFVIFSKDMNGYCGNICMEYAWVHLSLVE